MKWVKPEWEEISLNCEINSYANAELQLTTN
jgi:coenzyme PQQ precursor peptide PqqA